MSTSLQKPISFKTPCIELFPPQLDGVLSGHEQDSSRKRWDGLCDVGEQGSPDVKLVMSRCYSYYHLFLHAAVHILPDAKPTNAQNSFMVYAHTHTHMHAHIY